MSPNKQTLLTHCIIMAGWDKAEAWAAAKRYAAMCPEWADLPELLKTEMLKRKAENENNPNP